MKLLASLASPYTRKVRVVLAEKKIECELELVDVNPAENPVSAHNPLGKVPTLVLDDGTALYDSRVIVEFLDARADQPLDPGRDARARRGAPLGSARRRRARRGAAGALRVAAREARAQQDLDRQAGGAHPSRHGGHGERARGAQLVPRRSLLARRHRGRLLDRLA